MKLSVKHFTAYEVNSMKQKENAPTMKDVAREAGVALGMALTAAQLSDGAMVRNVVLFSVLIYELVGPTLTKNALFAAGEIHPDEMKPAAG